MGVAIACRCIFARLVALNPTLHAPLGPFSPSHPRGASPAFSPLPPSSQQQQPSPPPVKGWTVRQAPDYQIGRHGDDFDVHTGHLAVRQVIGCMMRWLQYHIQKKTQRAVEMQITRR